MGPLGQSDRGGIPLVLLLCSAALLLYLTRSFLKKLRSQRLAHHCLVAVPQASRFLLSLSFLSLPSLSFPTSRGTSRVTGVELRFFACLARAFSRSFVM